MERKVRKDSERKLEVDKATKRKQVEEWRMGMAVHTGLGYAQ